MQKSSTTAPRRKVAKPCVVVVATFPPPVNGMAVVTQAVWKLVAAELPAVACNVSPTGLYGPHRPLGVLIKLGRHLIAWLRLPVLRIHGAKTLYMPLDSQLGLFFNLITLSLARILGMRVVLHHHVANYIVAPSRMMQLLNGLTRADDLQIFNCRNLLQKFQHLYPTVARMRHISNSAFINVEAEPARTRADRSTLVLGMVAVLTIEKGLGILLDLLDAAARECLSISMIIAGPIHQKEAQQRIDAAIADHPSRLEYRGAVFGAEKERFFHDIDLFVFPTLYRLETEPLVVIEALSYERPVIAFARGCISEVVGDSGGALVNDDEDFVARALTECRRFLDDPEALPAAQRLAGARAVDRANYARVGGRQLIDALSHGAGG